jgi:hypothetical protein
VSGRRRLLVSLLLLGLLGCRPEIVPSPPTPMPVTGDGLLGRYYASRDWSGPIMLEQIDPVVEFDWSTRHPIDATVFSVRWQGYLMIPPGEGGAYTLFLRSDDASWLYLDGQLVVDNGGIHTAQLRSGQVDLTPGPHQLRIDFAELEPRLSLISFQWRRPNGIYEGVPAAVLYSKRPGGA